MKKYIFVLIWMLLILMISMFFIELGITTKDVREFDYQHTKAICDDNKCRDFLISCKDGEVVSINPVTGFVVFEENWEDPRSEELRERIC